jgi:phosphatidylglycerophosphate synthase
VNRPLSRPAARVLARTPLRPNGATLLTLAVAVAAGAMTAAGWSIAGGVAIQAASVVDGVDGELARLKGMATRFGAVFDAVSDRYADAAMLGGMTVYAARFEEWPHPVVIGMLALAGALSVSYSRSRIEASLLPVIREGEAAGGRLDALFGLGSRDVRSLIAAAGTIAGQCYWTLAVLAALAGLTVAWRLAYLRVREIGTDPA